MVEKPYAQGAHHAVTQDLLREELIIHWFMMFSSFIKWSFFHHLQEPNLLINLASPLPLQYERV